MPIGMLQWVLSSYRFFLIFKRKLKLYIFLEKGVDLENNY